jgi:hypothetical protein
MARGLAEGDDDEKGTFVIASQRVGAKRRPMTGSAKQSRITKRGLDCFVAALLAMTERMSSR